MLVNVRKGCNHLSQTLCFLVPEIYGRLAIFWDLGPYRAEVKKNLWWKYFLS
ncbi:Glycyl-tRNA synthetase [endosymbiont GvMRE of Glomus versiforme]|nr:Glycyl-tRNA synthetase [endosymbiont GvMRE of Glomus versiforme]